MFLCRIFITPGGAGPTFKLAVEQSLMKLARRFDEFCPTVTAINHWVEFENVDPQVVADMETFLKARRVDYDAVIEEKCSDAELRNAQYVPLLVDGDFIDENKNGEPLNQYAPGECESCALPADDRILNPLMISEDNVRKIQDLYHASNGILIVSQKFMSVIGERLLDDVHVGDVVFAESSRPNRLKNPYFWLRPRHCLGNEACSQVRRRCEVCGTPLEVRKSFKTGDKFRDAQVILEHFADKKYDMALSGNWYGERTRERPMSMNRDIYISGDFYFFLRSHKLKGLVRPSNVVVGSDSTEK